MSTESGEVMEGIAGRGERGGGVGAGFSGGGKARFDGGWVRGRNEVGGGGGGRDGGGTEVE